MGGKRGEIVRYCTELGRERGKNDERLCLRVYVVYPDEVVLDENLALFGCRDGQVGSVLQDFCPAGLFDQDACHCFGELGGCHSSGLQW